MSSRIATRFFVLGRKVLPSTPIYSQRLFSSCTVLCGRGANPHYWSEEVASSTHVDTGSIADTISQQTSVADTISHQTSVVDAISQQTNLTDAVSGLTSAGLGGYTPVGIIQHALEFLHVQANMPWWAAIANHGCPPEGSAAAPRRVDAAEHRQDVQHPARSLPDIVEYAAVQQDGRPGWTGRRKD
eukprot:Em0728g1a